MWLYTTRTWSFRIEPDPNNQNMLAGWTDTNWAGCRETRQRTACGLIVWSKVVLSSCARTLIGAELVCVGDTLTTWGYAAQCRALTDRCLLRKIIRNPIGCIRSETLGKKKGIFGYSRRWKKAPSKRTPCLGNSTLPGRILSSWTWRKTRGPMMWPQSRPQEKWGENWKIWW